MNIDYVIKEQLEEDLKKFNELIVKLGGKIEEFDDGMFVNIDSE